MSRSFAVFCLVLLSGLALAQGRVTLSGLVVTGINPKVGNVIGRGEPLGGVTVQVEGTTFQTESSSNGYFQFLDLPDGDYRLLASKPGYPSASQLVRVRSGGVASRCQLVLNPQASSFVNDLAVIPGDLFVAYGRKPPNVNDMESSPFKNLWQMVIAAGGTIRVAPEHLPHSAQASGQAYLMNSVTSMENCLMVFPWKNPSRSDFLALPARPYWLTFDRSGRFLYVGTAGKIVQVLDARRGYKLHRNLPFPGAVTDLTLSQDGRYVLVSRLGDRPGVHLIDTTTQLPVGFIPTPSPVQSACLVGNRLFTCSGTANSGRLDAYDAASARHLGGSPVAAQPTCVQASPDGRRLWIACSGSASVSVMDSLNLKELKLIRVEISPQRLALSPDGSRCLVSNRQSHTVSVIDTAALECLEHVEVGKAPVGICYSRDGQRAYVACHDSGVVMVLDGRSGQVVHTTIPLPNAVPMGVTLVP